MTKFKYKYIVPLIILTLSLSACGDKVPRVPEFFDDIGKTLIVLKNEHPEAEVIIRTDAFPDAAAACFGEQVAEYDYYFFGGQDGDLEKAMNECKEQLKCAGFVTIASVLFPEMKEEMSFSDFFSLIDVSDYIYFSKEDQSVGQGWLRFEYNNMDVWLNANDPTVDYSEFTDVEIVKNSAPVTILDMELFSQNQELAETVMW